jgi:hypothetical protein
MSKNLGNVDSVTTILGTDSILVEIGGSIRRITVDELQAALNQGQKALLQQVAWGVPLEKSSSPAWGVVGNTVLRDEYLSHVGRIFLTNDGKAAKLSATDSSVFADGTALDETQGHVMFYAPRLYYLVQTDEISGLTCLWMSQIPIGGHYIEESCFGAYMGYMNGAALTSRSGVNVTASKAITQFWNAAQVNGKNFGLINYDHQRLMIMLNLSKFGNPNCQTNVGYGTGGSGYGTNVFTQASALLTGATKSLGDSCGKIDITLTNSDNVSTTDASRVNFFGIEDPWCWYWCMVQGLYFGSSANEGQTGSEVFIYEGNRLPTSSELTTHPNGTYRQIVRQTSSVYPKTLVLGEYFDIFAKTGGANFSSYWCDYNYNSATGQLPLWGGFANRGSLAGLGYADTFNAWSAAHAAIGSRLAYYGRLQWMSGSNLIASL